jgi:hypothetical protein
MLSFVINLGQYSLYYHYDYIMTRVHLTVGNRSGYRGNRSYRSGSVRKKLGNRSLTEPSKPLFSVYRSVLPVYRTGFGGLENRSGSGFLNPDHD